MLRSVQLKSDKHVYGNLLPAVQVKQLSTSDALFGCAENSFFWLEPFWNRQLTLGCGEVCTGQRMDNDLNRVP